MPLRNKIAFALALLAIGLAGCGDDEPVSPPTYTVIETFAGTGLPAISVDSLPAQQSALYWPQDMTFGPDSNLYIADSLNRRIRKVTPDGLIGTIAGNGQPLPQ